MIIALHRFSRSPSNDGSNNSIVISNTTVGQGVLLLHLLPIPTTMEKGHGTSFQETMDRYSVCHLKKQQQQPR